jgi:hypothetical protein
MVEFILQRGMDIQHKGWDVASEFSVAAGMPIGWRAVAEAELLHRYGTGRSLLLMYHHILETLRARFPGAAELEGWSKEEIASALETGVLEGVRLPSEYKKVLAVLSDVRGLLRREPLSAEHAAILADSDSLGRYIGKYVSEFVEGMLALMDVPTDPVRSADFSTNLMNKKFWKLHGFIDRVWMEFLAAKGFAVPQEALEFSAEMWELLRYRDEVPPGIERYL